MVGRRESSYTATLAFSGIVLSMVFSGCSPVSRDSFTQLANVSDDQVTHNYVFFGRDRERISEPGFLETPRFEGAQLTYAWKELESDEGVYDFSEIQKDLNFLTERRKKLFIQLQDTTFNPSIAAVPRYMINDPRFHGGVVYQYDDNGNPEGLVALRWDPAVQGQFHKLLQALGRAFDGKIAGINLQETAIGVSEEGSNAPAGFTYAGYRDAIHSNLTALRQAFSRSLPMQYINYMPGEWLPDDDRSYMRSLFEYGRDIGVAVGAPDLMPQNPNQKKHAYKFMRELTDAMVLGVAVQDGNYGGTTGADNAPTAPWPNIVPDLFEFANGHLGVDYVFWGAQEPYFSHDVVPYFRGVR